VPAPGEQCSERKRAVALAGMGVTDCAGCIGSADCVCRRSRTFERSLSEMLADFFGLVNLEHTHAYVSRGCTIEAQFKCRVESQVRRAHPPQVLWVVTAHPHGTPLTLPESPDSTYTRPAAAGAATTAAGATGAGAAAAGAAAAAAGAAAHGVELADGERMAVPAAIVLFTYAAWLLLMIWVKKVERGRRPRPVVVDICWWLEPVCAWWRCGGLTLCRLCRLCHCVGCVGCVVGCVGCVGTDLHPLGSLWSPGAGDGLGRGQQGLIPHGGEPDHR